MTDSIGKQTALRWAKRCLVYLAGLYLIALGVALSARSSLGVSPVGSPANVLYQIGLAENAPGWVNLGNCTIVVYFFYILAELLVLRRDFKPVMLLQLLVSFLFGKLVNLASAMLSFLPEPGSYAVRMLYLVLSIPPVAAGVMLYISPKILPMPAEGMSLAVAGKTGWSVGTCKMLFDCSVVVISAAMSLFYFHRLVGVREGTVICAVFVGILMKPMMRAWQGSILRFVEREDKTA